MKKKLKIFGLIFLIILSLLVAIPFVFQSQIKEMVKRLINENVNAKVEFSDVNLSLLRSFPKAHVSIDDIVITNFKPFQDETFATAKSLVFNMSVKELFKKPSDGPIIVNTIELEETMLTLKTNSRGDVNYDIAKKSNDSIQANSDSNKFSFDIKEYSITNSAFTYIDEKSDLQIYITDLNHSGKGTFSEDLSELDTNTEARVSLSIDSTQYLRNNTIKLDALFDLDLKNNKYTFKENEGFINALPLEFQGYVQNLEEGQDINITFENPSSSFKDFLAVIPSAYSKDLRDVETSGDFKVKGEIKGLSSETTIPHLDINVASNNASFKYPNLPKRIDNIQINTSLKNDNGNSEDTYVQVDAFNFKLDNDAFNSSGTLKNITKNMLVDAHVDGVLNLSNLSKAYPITLEKELSGILKGSLNTSFDMNAIDSNAYSRIKNNGNISIVDFIFSSEEIVNPIHISKADLTFKPGTVLLNNFKANTGESDIDATGTVKNLLGFLLSDNKLQGDFKVNSKRFAVNDFMVEDTSETVSNKTTSNKESLKIPAFLDCLIYADAETVLYDNLTLKNVKGKMRIKDEQATLENMTSNIFDGNLAISGLVNTTAKTPRFTMNLGINSFDISQSFNGLELLQSLAPIAKVLQGKLNSTIQLSGNLDEEFSLDLNSVSGNAIAELLTTTMAPNNVAILDKLKGSLEFIDFEKLDFNDLKTKLNFENGNVSVKPFSLYYEDIKITVDGAHGFDKTLNYNAVFQVPAKYLGSDINRLIGKINDDAVNSISIPVIASIEGTFSAPTVKTDLTSGISKLTKQLIEIEKQKLLNDGKDKLEDLIGDVLGGNTNESDSTTTNTENPMGTIFDDIIQGNPNIQNDSTSTQQNNPIQDVLGDILGGKKKEKDSLN